MLNTHCQAGVGRFGAFAVNAGAACKKVSVIAQRLHGLRRTRHRRRRCWRWCLRRCGDGQRGALISSCFGAAPRCSSRCRCSGHSSRGLGQRLHKGRWRPHRRGAAVFQHLFQWQLRCAAWGRRGRSWRDWLWIGHFCDDGVFRWQRRCARHPAIGQHCANNANHSYRSYHPHHASPWLERSQWR